MRRWIILGRLLLCAVLACVSGLSQEPYEARAARLQPEDIPPLIQKAQDGALSSQVLLWLAYSTFGGLLIVGVNEKDGKPQDIVGVQLGTELKTQIASSISANISPTPSFGIAECLP